MNLARWNSSSNVIISGNFRPMGMATVELERSILLDVDPPIGSQVVQTADDQKKTSVDNIFLTVGSLDAFGYLPALPHGAQSADQQLWILDRKTKRLEELGFTAIVGMRRIQQIVDDLVSLDDGAKSAVAPLPDL